jgi:flagellar basal body-associated protein FliL
MQKIFVLVILIILVFLFALPSASQSYASARQAQAVIETSRATQIANFGNLLVIAILAVMLLAALGVIVYLLWRTRQTSQSRWVSGPNANWGQQQIQQPDANALLPALMAALALQMMNNQQHQSPRLENDSLFRQRYDVETILPDDPNDIPWTL